MLPERFGRYEVLAELGDGAMGRVYTAWDPVVSRTVAVKTVKLESLSRQMADEFLQRFRREAQAAGALNHPNIVGIYDVGEDHLVMELVEGQTLQEAIRQKGHLEPRAALEILGPVAEAVDHAHAAGIIHRDIKPANIMIQPDGQPKLMDFGVAHVDDSVMTATGQIIGSPSYMSPEQVAGQEVTPRSDVYSLAVVAYEMVTGRSPFQAKTVTAVIYRVMHDAPPPPRQRYASASELAAALDIREFELNLDDLIDEGTAAPEPAAPPSPEPVTPTVRPTTAAPPVRPWIVGVGLAAVAAAAAFAWLTEPGLPPLPLDPSPPPLAAAPSPPPTSPAPTPVPEAPTPSPRKAAPTPRVEATPTPAPAVLEGQLVELGPGVTPPKRIEGRPATYPRAARRLNISGTVVVNMIISEDGEPLDPQVTESAGSILDEAVLEAVRGWRFEPALKDGVRVRVQWTLRQTFRSR